MTFAYTYSNVHFTLNPKYVLEGYTSTDKSEKHRDYPLSEDEELTRFFMEASESALEEVWSDEDDEYWSSFLKE